MPFILQFANPSLVNIDRWELCDEHVFFGRIYRATSTFRFRYWRRQVDLSRRFHDERASGLASSQDIDLAWFARAGKVESALTAAEVAFIPTRGQFGNIWAPFLSMPTLIVDNSVGWHLETNSFHQHVRLI